MKVLDVKWNKIKKVQELKVVKSMYVWLFIVPILVKTFNEVEDRLSLKIFDEIFHVDIGLPFSFWIFYSSAFCFVVANIIYQLVCPLLIQENSSWREFADHGKNESHLDEYVTPLNLEDDVLRDGWNIDPKEASGGKVQVSFWYFYRIADTNQSFRRKLAYCFNVLAFIGIGVVVLQNLITVVSYAIT
ncbi:MAG: hypothetical protein ACI9D5_000007 [Candidatus Endobugula sp.]|jgi:hypothetical protein